jgi:choline dehydrogenase
VRVASIEYIEDLRVADASIMQTLIGGKANAPAIMIGEKTADLIRAPGRVNARNGFMRTD